MARMTSVLVNIFECLRSRAFSTVALLVCVLEGSEVGESIFGLMYEGRFELEYGRFVVWEFSSINV